MTEDSPPASWTPAAGPPATGLIADINLRRYTFASRESIWTTPLPSPSAKRSLYAPSSKASPSQDVQPGLSRTPKSSTALAHPYLRTPTAPKSRTVSFRDLDRASSADTEEDVGGGSKRVTSSSKAIPKPSGETGRSDRGYHLKDMVEWDADLHRKIEVFVKASADAKLNLTMSLTKQQDGKVQEIIDEVREKYPQASIDDYIDGWPIRDILMTYLKRTKDKARRKRR